MFNPGNKINKKFIAFLEKLAYIIAYVNYRSHKMKTISITKARSNLYKLIDETANVHEPIQIIGKRTNAVLISEDDWRAIQETLYLLSIPGMRESIREGLKTPLEECSEVLEW